MPAYTRGPALLAQSAAALAEAAPGRFALGIGTSSNVIVERWNGIPFDEPYRRTRDLIRFLRLALAGEKVDAAFDTFTVKGFRLGRPPEVAPPILVAALRPGMLRLAGREGDGAIINWLSADDVTRVVREVGPGKEIVARIFVLPIEDADAARAVARRMITAYLNVPVYAAFHEWLGRGPALKEMWAAWSAGDRKAALAAIPDEVVDDLVLHGSPAEVRAGHPALRRQRGDDRRPSRSHPPGSTPLQADRAPGPVRLTGPRLRPPSRRATAPRPGPAGPRPRLAGRPHGCARRGASRRLVPRDGEPVASPCGHARRGV